MHPMTRNRLVFAGGATLFLGMLYQIAIEPALNSAEWKRIQKVTRKDIDQESIQPGGMRVWSDPFGPKPPPKRP